MSYTFMYSIKRNVKLILVSGKKESERASVYMEEAGGIGTSEYMHIASLSL